MGVHLDRGPSSCGPHYSSQSPPPTLQASVTPKPAASPQATKVGPSSASSANDSVRGRVPRSELTSKISSGDQSVSRSPSHHSPKSKQHDYEFRSPFVKHPTKVLWKFRFD
ncbi:unnamed protein product [Anisakis simplex]|uniref:Uncharacterized protein n=1 Tax=Anisakis simplex TaxID=6269 RepID=A0A0M3J691_ANISI|nr:unnamed protein product [Anisakis simplex]